MDDLDRIVNNLLAIPRPQRAHFLLQVKDTDEDLYIKVMEKLRYLEDDRPEHSDSTEA